MACVLPPPRLLPLRLEGEREGGGCHAVAGAAAGARPHPCPHPGCMAMFQRKEHVVRHLRAHTDMGFVRAGG